jgi:tripartite-type tricarboxylate transporter receptor subunit TctC
LILAIFALGIVKPVVQADQHDSYSSKNLRIIVGYAPGGGYDFYARMLEQIIAPQQRQAWAKSQTENSVFGV